MTTTFDRGRHGTGRSGRSVVWLVVPASMLVVVVVAAALGAVVAPHTLTDVVDAPFSPAGPGSPLGTDRLGRDVWSRLMLGGAPVAATATLATSVATVIGVPVGVLLAGRSGRSSLVATRLLDVAIVVPPLVVLLVVLSRFDDSRTTIGVTVGLIGAPLAARLALAAADPVWRRAHVEQAFLRGEHRYWIALHEITPCIIGPLVADAGIRFAAVITVTTGATVLGYGPDPPAADWASMLADNLSGATLNPWASVAPAIAISLLAVSANLTADEIARRLAR